MQAKAPDSHPVHGSINGAITMIMSATEEQYGDVDWNLELMQHMAFIEGCAATDRFRSEAEDRKRIGSMVLGLFMSDQQQREGGTECE